ncbi:MULTISPECIES: hypothetical protein [unclassified Streptomyces]|uniref:hypothetical protein n=1 Tax=unclassified Streptomyces TaxID=2593676 RepID=UPI002DDC61E7|nr:MULTISPECIES: hypothetical protein [unclassified Streptomyces]WSE08779.1 hypothetical protein OG574_38700 [Streptomyces sp. NBC_01445]
MSSDRALLELTYQPLDLPMSAREARSLTLYTAEPGTPDEDRIKVLSSWAATRAGDWVLDLMPPWWLRMGCAAHRVRTSGLRADGVHRSRRPDHDPPTGLAAQRSVPQQPAEEDALAGQSAHYA